MDELKYQRMEYYYDEKLCLNFEIHYEYSNDSTIYDWQHFQADELIDLIDHKTDIREYQIKSILENPKKHFLIDFLIEDLNEKVHKIITVDFEDVIIKRKEEQDIKAGVSHYDQEILSSPEIES